MYPALVRFFQRPWFYPFAKTVFRIGARLIWGVRSEGRELVPREGGLVVASNHIGTLDPPVVGTEVPRHISYMAKKELFDAKLPNLVFRGVDAFPVDRTRSDVSAVKEALRRLKAGDAIGIFIQGTRNRGDAAALDGAAFLAQRAKVPIVPAALWREGRRFHVRFGEPFMVPGRDREAMREATATTMRRINELLPEEARMLPPADDAAPPAEPVEPSSEPEADPVGEPRG